MSNRQWSPYSGSHSPIAYIRGVPIELTTLLVTAHVMAMVVTAAIMGLAPADLAQWQRWTVFTTNFLTTGPCWTPLTYPFYHDIRVEHIFFVFEMLMFWWFGREVERFIGRKPFALLYAALLLAQPLALMALRPALGGAAVLAGSGMLTFGMGVAFTAIYPNAQFFGVVRAKWIVGLLLFVFTVFFLAKHDFSGLTQLWTSALVACLFIRNAGVGAGSGLMDKLENWQLARAERKSRARADADRQRQQREEANVDAVLEKISRSGLSSLSGGEQEILQRERRKLLAKERR